MTYDDIPHLSAKIKPKQQKVGLRFVRGAGREGRGACGTARPSGPGPEWDGSREERGVAGSRPQGAAGAAAPRPLPPGGAAQHCQFR